MKGQNFFSNRYVVIVAGGKGSRMGTNTPKQFLLINGLPVLMHTINAFHNYDFTMTILVVLPEAQKQYWQELCEKYHFDREHLVVSGGITRFHSVKNALRLVPEEAYVAIHDGVRPLVSKEVIAKTFAAAEISKAACPAIPVTDSIRKRIENRTKRLDRSQYILMQTPQVFWADYLINAYQQEYSEQFTDDFSVVEAHRYFRPAIVEGSPENIKITTPIDLVIAEAILKCRI